MKDDRDIILSSKELYTQKKIRCNSSFNLISLKCGTSVKNYLSNSFYPACILIRNKNKALYRFLIDLKKFVKLLSFFIFIIAGLCPLRSVPGGYTPPVLLPTLCVPQARHLLGIGIKEPYILRIRFAKNCIFIINFII